nr:CBL-interacting serine/threonine-protein kinase 12-like [Ipomoea batatas]
MAAAATSTAARSSSKKEYPGGLILDRYEVGKLLGHGTFAKVYHARNIKTNESVAIKVIDKEKILRVGLTAHVKREVSILRRVRHPNIVQLYEVMATKSKIFFVMEYVKGGELFNKVAKGRLKEDDARKYFQQLISAVAFCHARGVFHRDLKPENILLDEDGNVKVSDFGLSAISEQIKQDGLFHTFCGTPAYVAPEVLARKGYDAAKSESEIESRRRIGGLPRPASLNAFDIISFSRGFDLSGLFEEGGDGERFVSGAPVYRIINKLEEIAKVVSFTVRKKDCRVSLEGTKEGAKGPLTIAAEIFELTPSLRVVEVKKKAGDKMEFEEFCKRELKPGLQNLMLEDAAADTSHLPSDIE